MRKTYTNRSPFFFVLLSLSLFGFKVNAQVNITANSSAQQLMNTLIGENVVAFNPQLTCGTDHSGTFSVVSSNLGLPNGIILSTGEVASDNPNFVFGIDQPASSFQSNNNISPGDPDLNAIVQQTNPSYITNDACVLEFDFVPDVDTISTLRFHYVFGSEEYPEFACSQFNDVFAFLLTGPLFTNQNIALVPNTTIPVAINSINMAPNGTGYPISNCNSMGTGSPFSSYYVDNEGLSGQTITYDGFTTVLEANAVVHPCDTYHIKLAVANTSDNAYQSGVFLEANSFSVDSVTLNLDGIIAADSGYLVEGCTPAIIKATRSSASTHKKKICLSYGGTAINGIDYPMLPDTLIIQPGSTEATMILDPIQDNITEPGFETIVIRRLNCCTLEPIDSVTIKVRDSLKMELLSVDTALCAGDQVTLHATGDPSFIYSWTPTTNVDNPNDTLTYAHPQETTTYTVTASFSSCPDVTRSFTATVEPIPVVTMITPDLNFCIGAPLRLQADVQPASFPNFTYTWTPATGLDDPTVKDPMFFVSAPGNYTYVLTATTPLGCAGSDDINIIARPAAEITYITPDFTAKYGDVVQLNAEGTLYYTWSPARLLDYPNIKDPKASALDTATFEVIGMNEWGCRDTAYVHMNIDYTMFEIVPNAFSPNNDGRNDVFRIPNLKYQRLLEFRIYNRWGEQIFDTTDPNRGWDGTYRGVPQEAGVYQYLIRIGTPDGKNRMYKGDVTLVR